VEQERSGVDEREESLFRLRKDNGDWRIGFPIMPEQNRS
jgi:hypothetical protein